MSDILRERLRARIEEKGTNPSAVSLAAGLSRSAVRDIISGKAKNPGFMTLNAIAKALDCTDDYLLGHDDNVHKRESTEIFIDINARTSDVSGVLEAGVFRQIAFSNEWASDEDDPFNRSDPPPTFRQRKAIRSKRRYVGRDLYVYLLWDNSMIGRHMLKGDFLIAVDPDGQWLDLLDGELLIVSMKLDGVNAEEVSARVVERDGGDVKLVCKSGATRFADIAIGKQGPALNTYHTSTGALLTIEGTVVSVIRQFEI